MPAPGAWQAPASRHSRSIPAARSVESFHPRVFSEMSTSGLGSLPLAIHLRTVSLEHCKRVARSLRQITGSGAVCIFQGQHDMGVCVRPARYWGAGFLAPLDQPFFEDLVKFKLIGDFP